MSSGVDTTLYAKDFYRKATKGQLKEREIGFSNIHPYVFADIKTERLIDALSLLKTDSLVLTSLVTSEDLFTSNVDSFVSGEPLIIIHIDLPLKYLQLAVLKLTLKINHTLMT